MFALHPFTLLIGLRLNEAMSLVILNANQLVFLVARSTLVKGRLFLKRASGGMTSSTALLGPL